jgi:hypothetical protein
MPLEGSEGSEGRAGSGGPIGSVCCAPGGTDRRQPVGVKTRRDAYISFDAVKAATDLAELVNESGIEISRSKMAHCPFHDDARPSLLVKGGRWRCFGCGEHGDVFDWCERYYRMDTAQALRYLAARAGFGPAGPGPSPDAQAAGRRRELRDRFFSWMHDERGKNADLIRRLDKTIDLFVAAPEDLATETAKYLYDRRAWAEGIDELLWAREWEALAEYYREETIDER